MIKIAEDAKPIKEQVEKLSPTKMGFEMIKLIPMIAILIKIRKHKGLSQLAVAKKIGVSYNTLCNWETGNTKPNIYNYIAWVNSLGHQVYLKKDMD